MAEQTAVNREVAGSSPASGANLGAKCYGSTAGSNPARWGPIPHAPAKIEARTRRPWVADCNPASRSSTLWRFSTFLRHRGQTRSLPRGRRASAAVVLRLAQLGFGCAPRLARRELSSGAGHGTGGEAAKSSGDCGARPRVVMRGINPSAGGKPSSMPP